MSEGTKARDMCEGKPVESRRVRYRRLSKRGEALIATAVFNEGETHRFYQTDGWDLYPWDFTPSLAEIAFAKGLLEETNADRAQEAMFNASQALDEDLAYDLLTVPDVCQDGFSFLERLARTVAVEQPPTGGLFSSLDKLRTVDQRGRGLVDEFLDVKRRIQNWLNEISDLESSWWTFDERIDGPAVAAV